MRLARPAEQGVTIRESEPWTSTDASGRLGSALRLLAAPVLEATPESSTAGREPLPGAPGRLEKLVVDFDEAYTAFVLGCEALPDESELLAIQAVDAKLSGMVRAADASLWTESAWRESECWVEVRVLAGRAIAAVDGSGGRS